MLLSRTWPAAFRGLTRSAAPALCPPMTLVHSVRYKSHKRPKPVPQAQPDPSLQEQAADALLTGRAKFEAERDAPDVLDRSVIRFLNWYNERPVAFNMLVFVGFIVCLFIGGKGWADMERRWADQRDQDLQYVCQNPYK